MAKKYCLLTNDVENISIWFNSLRDKTGQKVLDEGLPLLLNLYEEYGVSTTFFVTGYIAKKLPKIVELISQHEHEIGSHGLSHKSGDGLDNLGFEEQKEHLTKSREILEGISGEKVISFRSPALRTNKYTAQALIEAGYMIDSSVASQRFDMFLSSGVMNKLKWLTAPRSPYRTSYEDITSKGSEGVVEVPLSALFFPYLGTTMRAFPKLSNFFRSILNLESGWSGKPIVFDIHPNELIDESDEERELNRRSNNPLKYLLQDWLRGHIKVKNLGEPALELYEQQILYFQERGYRFATLREYARIKGFL